MTGFWLVNPVELLNSCEIIPSKKMVKTEQFNSLTRLLLFICVILFVMEWDYACPFLFFGLLLIVISYYSQMDNYVPPKENFEECYVNNPIHIPPTGPRVDSFGSNNVNHRRKEIATPDDKGYRFNPTRKSQGFTSINTLSSPSGNAVTSHGYMSRDEVDSLFNGCDKVMVGSSEVESFKCGNCESKMINGWCQGCGMGGDDGVRAVANPEGGLGNDHRDVGKTINRNGNPHVWFRTGKLQEEGWKTSEQNNQGNFLYDRYDPQSVRNSEDLDPERAAEMPCRSPWSRKISRLEADSASVPINSIHESDFGDYKTGFMDYKDAQGSYKYQVPEAAYPYPVFGRSKVDHMLHLNPMYGVTSEAKRLPNLEEAKSLAESQWLRDSQGFRNEIMGEYMNKISSRRMQQRIAPLSSAGMV
jgi:hypothetical protein